ncbi:MAG: tRNA (adenosine(37)-N6)-threonylcarbamoyltransferase complex ATPase subunit type 1 TsaE [Verrucomicrobiales bacterium]
MVTHISPNPEYTRQLGFKLGEKCGPGLIIGLIGDLGAGKTRFAQGIAEGLGITERVASPTFALVNEYTTGRMPCFHLDLYRLETPQQIIGAGLDHYFSQKQGVTIIEWFDRWLDFEKPLAPTLMVLFHVVGPEERQITYENLGA